MKNYKHIATFTYPSELAVARSILEVNEIDCYVKDEITVQVHNFYSNAIGGIRLEVPDDEYHDAYEILSNSGYNQFLNENIKTETSEIQTKEFSKLNKGLRFVIISIISIAVIFILIFLFQILVAG